MSQVNKFWKTLIGQNSQVFVAKAVAYTTDATFKDFAENAVAGEIGVFQEDGTAYDGAGAADGDAKIFIALKRDSQVERSVVFTLNSLNVSRTPYVAPVKQSSTLELSATVPTAGQLFEIGILDTTVGNQPFPTYNYVVKAVSGETVDSLGAKLEDVINNTTSVANKDRDLVVTATYDSGTNTLTIEAVDYGTTFRILARQDLVAVATIVYDTAMKLGSGFYTHVKLLQDAGDIYKGVTTNFPEQGATPADFGAPTDFVSSALNYHIFDLSGFGSEGSKTPHKKQYFNRSIIVCIPTAGGPDTELTTVLGL